MYYATNKYAGQFDDLRTRISLTVQPMVYLFATDGFKRLCIPVGWALIE